MTRRLPWDISRCAGRSDWTAETSICPRRNDCLRYVSLVAQDYGPRTPWVLWACTTDDFDQREPLGAEP